MMPPVKPRVSRAQDLPAFLRPVSSEMTQRPELSEVRFTLIRLEFLRTVSDVQTGHQACCASTRASNRAQQLALVNHYLRPK